MSIELIIHAGTKLALHQWLDARDLGDNVQDVDAESPTFGDWIYTHRVGQFHYWNHPSGKVPATYDVSIPEAPVVTFFSGFYARLSFADTIPANLQTWVETSTATSILESFNGVGGEGITIVNPEDVYQFLDGIGAPIWGGLMGVPNRWSDPALWAFQNVMTGDERDFDGVTYRSLIDFNVWTPTQAPQGWQEVVVAVGEWASGVAYAVDDEAAYLGTTYRCLQAHTSIIGWEPPNVPALWTEVV